MIGKHSVDETKKKEKKLQLRIPLLWNDQKYHGV
jgi:hypothetical protein